MAALEPELVLEEFVLDEDEVDDFAAGDDVSFFAGALLSVFAGAELSLDFSPDFSPDFSLDLRSRFGFERLESDLESLL